MAALERCLLMGGFPDKNFVLVCSWDHDLLSAYRMCPLIRGVHKKRTYCNTMLLNNTHSPDMF